jgi:hypothetical protein
MWPITPATTPVLVVIVRSFSKRRSRLFVRFAIRRFRHETMCDSDFEIPLAGASS